MDVQWLSWSNGCHKAMDVTKQWMSQTNGCHKAMYVTKQWMSQSNGCHKAMAVTEQWMSQSNGCHKDLEGSLARKLRFHRTKRVSEDVWGSLSGGRARLSRLSSDHARIGHAVELTVQVSFS